MTSPHNTQKTQRHQNGWIFGRFFFLPWFLSSPILVGSLKSTPGGWNLRPFQATKSDGLGQTNFAKTAWTLNMEAPSQRNSMFNVQAVLQSLFGPDISAVQFEPTGNEWIALTAAKPLPNFATWQLIAMFRGHAIWHSMCRGSPVLKHVQIPRAPADCNSKCCLCCFWKPMRIECAAQKIPYFMNSFSFPPETGQRFLQICCGWHCSGSAFTTQFHVQCPGCFAKFVWPSPSDFVAWNGRRFQPPGVDFNEPTKIGLDKNQGKKKKRPKIQPFWCRCVFWVLWGEVICFAFVEFVCWLRCRPELFFLTYFDSACLSAMALLIVSEGFWVNSSDGANEQGKQTTRWWFQMFFSFTTTWGNDPIWRACFSHGWFSHQLD